MSSVKGPISLISEWVKLRRAIKEFKPQILHAHYGTVTGWLAGMSRCPVVVTFRGSDLNPNAARSRLGNALAIAVSQAASLRADGIICVSRGLVKKLWFKKDRARVITDGVDLGLFCPIDRRDARQALGWSEEEQVVLFNAGPGRNPNKRIDLATGAVAKARGRFPKLRLEVMAGEVNPDRVPLLMNGSDLLLMVSDREGSPNVVREAIACNTPVVTVEVGDVLERLKGVSSSEIVERSCDSIAKGILSILENPGVRSNGATVAYEFSLEKTVKEIALFLFQTAKLC